MCKSSNLIEKKEDYLVRTHEASRAEKIVLLAITFAVLVGGYFALKAAL